VTSRVDYQTEPDAPPPHRNIGGSFVKAGISLVIIVVVLAVGISGAKRLAASLSPDTVTDDPVAEGEVVIVVVPPGSSARAIGLILEDGGVVVDGGDFERAARNSGQADSLQAGRYRLLTGTDPDELVAIFVAGPPDEGSYRVTVIEGLRVEQMLGALADQSPYELEDFANALRAGDVFSPFLPTEAPRGSSDLARWEGLLAPDTYDFDVSATPEDVLQRMATTLTDRVQAVDWSELENRGLTSYDGLIIASLIEREAKLDDDRPLIASVIVNRLDRSIALQIDATIIYALGRNPGRIVQDDLDIDSPYNTYRNPGLPPTPIAGVRNASLLAAANPADTRYLYYVVVSADGRHGFSETLEEHNAKVAQARADGIIP
jgi:peptidoglycan lytic transglycosylase G